MLWMRVLALAVAGVLCATACNDDEETNGGPGPAPTSTVPGGTGGGGTGGVSGAGTGGQTGPECTLSQEEVCYDPVNDCMGTRICNRDETWGPCECAPVTAGSGGDAGSGGTAGSGGDAGSGGTAGSGGDAGTGGAAGGGGTVVTYPCDPVVILGGHTTGPGATDGLYVFDGTSTTLISDPSHNVYWDAALDPTGTYVAYMAEGPMPFLGTVFVVPVDGSAPPQMVLSVGVASLTWAPDGSRLAIWDGGTLSVSPADGTYSVVIDAQLTGIVLFAPEDNSMIVYEKADGLYFAPADGTGTPTRIGPPVLGLEQWALSPVAPVATYIADVDANDPGSELYAVNLDGSGLLKLSGDDVSSWMSGIFSPDGQQIAFKANLDADPELEVGVAAVDGSGVSVLSGAGEVFEENTSLRWNPDSTALAYVINDGAGDPRGAVRTVSSDGTNGVIVSGDPADTDEVYLSYDCWQGSSILYYQGTSVNLRTNYVAFADGSSPPVNLTLGTAAPGVTDSTWVWESLHVFVQDGQAHAVVDSGGGSWGPEDPTVVDPTLPDVIDPGVPSGAAVVTVFRTGAGMIKGLEMPESSPGAGDAETYYCCYERLADGWETHGCSDAVPNGWELNPR